MKVSELRKSLADIGGFSPEQIEEMVAARLASGSVEDDTANVDPAEVAKMASEVRKALANLADGSETIQKGETPTAEKVIEEDNQGQTWIKVDDSLESVVRSVNSQATLLGNLVKAANTSDSNLAKGLLAVGRLAEMNVNAVRGLATQVENINKALGDIQERLGQPSAPRAMNPNYRPVPHPADSAPGVQKPEGETVQKSYGDVMSKLQTELRTARDSNNMSRVSEIATAVGELQSGVPLSEVTAKYNLTV